MAVANKGSGRVPDPNAELADIGVTKTRKGLAFDLETIDDKLKKRLTRNRESADRCRVRKNAALQSLQDQKEQLRARNEEMAAQMQRMTDLIAAHGLSLDSSASAKRARGRLQERPSAICLTL